jgi:hypothetical protein
VAFGEGRSGGRRKPVHAEKEHREQRKAKLVSGGGMKRTKKGRSVPWMALVKTPQKW